MPYYLLSPQAQKSLKQISHYTQQNFGAVQKRKYLNLLRAKMRVIAEAPTSGKERSDIKAGYYSLSVEKHTIYYRIHDSYIDIIDVLHQSMEPKLHL